MSKSISIISVVILLYHYNYSQQKNFGYRNSNGTVSTEFLIQDGFVLDSVNSTNQKYRFEYNHEGKLSRDINIIKFPTYVTVDGRPMVINIPGCRDYYYNSKGNIDSMVATGWDDNLSMHIDNPSGYTIHYSYDNNGMLLLEATSKRGVVSSIDKYSYDSAGNLTSIQTTFAGSDTAYEIREYDSLSRLTMIKNIINGTLFDYQYTYRYDSSGNVNYLIQTSYTGKISNKYNYYFKFDESGKVADETFLYTFLPDSTWGDTLEITFNYDEFGRIIQMGQSNWFHYNQDGNLDSMVLTHTVFSGYLANKGTFIDSYGNSITLPNYLGYDHFYYKKLITGIKKEKSNNKTFSLSQNYPNPFNPLTTINYSIPSAEFVTLKVYDILGREIASLVNDERQPGEYSVKFDGSGLSSGIYFYHLQSGEYTLTKKFILMK